MEQHAGQGLSGIMPVCGFQLIKSRAHGVSSPLTIKGAHQDAFKPQNKILSF